jgi:hypothetical protein
MAVFLDPFGHESVHFQIDEAGPVGKFTDEFLVNASELLAELSLMVPGLRMSVSVPSSC